MEPVTTECRADAGECDVAETCDGAGACPADSFEPSGTTCGDPSDTDTQNFTVNVDNIVPTIAVSGATNVNEGDT